MNSAIRRFAFVHAGIHHYTDGVFEREEEDLQGSLPIRFGHDLFEDSPEIASSRQLSTGFLRDSNDISIRRSAGPRF